MRWTEKEIDTLKENYSTSTILELQAALPKRTRSMINSMIKRLKAEGKLGEKTEEAKKRAYKQRNNTKNDFIFTVNQKRG